MLDRLLKLLNLTTSDNDHEALSAIRQANALRVKENLMWKNLIVVPEQKLGRHAAAAGGTADDELGPACSNKAAWIEIFTYLENVYLSDRQGDLVSNIGGFYANRGYMSDKQRMCVYSIYKQKGGEQ